MSVKGQDHYLTLAAGHSDLKLKSKSKIMLSHLKPIFCESLSEHRNENLYN